MEHTGEEAFCFLCCPSPQGNNSRGTQESTATMLWSCRAPNHWYLVKLASDQFHVCYSTLSGWPSTGMSVKMQSSNGHGNFWPNVHCQEHHPQVRLCGGKLIATYWLETRLCGDWQRFKCLRTLQDGNVECIPVWISWKRCTKGWASCGRDVKDYSGHLRTLDHSGKKIQKLTEVRCETNLSQHQLLQDCHLLEQYLLHDRTSIWATVHVVIVFFRTGASITSPHNSGHSWRQW